MHRRPSAQRTIRSGRGGPVAAIAGITVAALVLFGAPALAAADELPPPDATVASEPVAEPAAEPAVEEPVVEEPAVEEPVAEEPAVEEPAAEEPAVEEPAAEEPAAEAEPAAEPAPEEEVPAPAARMAEPLVTGPPVIVKEWNDKVGICHSTMSETNPFVFISPSVRSIIDGAGGDPEKAHSVHHDYGDIIPAFWYQLIEDGDPIYFPGLNTDKTELTEGDCGEEPPPTPALEVVGLQCPGPDEWIGDIDVTASGLIDGVDYELILLDAELVVLDTEPFTADGDWFEHTFWVADPGLYTVVLRVVESDDSVSMDVFMQSCPQAPPTPPDLVLVKDAATEGGEPVVPGEDEVITYTLTITNVGGTASYNSYVEDELPGGVTYVDGSAVVSPNPEEWEVMVADGMLTAQHTGWIMPGDEITITFEVTVTGAAAELPQLLVNTACVWSSDPPSPERAMAAALAAGDGIDVNPDDNCDDATTPVKPSSAPPKPTPKPTPAPAPVPVTPAGLAATGVETSGMLPIAALLMLLGAFAIGGAMRRRRAG